MRKLVLLISTLLLSMSCIAAKDLPRSLKVDILSTLQQKAIANVTKQPIMYGGQDISRVAIANQPLWKGQPSFIG